MLSAQYLLRFEGLCPTMSREWWPRFSDIILEFGLCPILAIVPSSEDPALTNSPPDPSFWEKMRRLESHGATIAIHGFRHLPSTPGGTEFAGVGAELQRHWIRSGLEILQGNGLSPRLWIPHHGGFDTNTLAVLNSEGLSLILRGAARQPLVRADQLFVAWRGREPALRSTGVWTIAIDSNAASAETAERLRLFLRLHADKFTSFDRMVLVCESDRYTLAARLRASSVSLIARLRALGCRRGEPEFQAPSSSR